MRHYWRIAVVAISFILLVGCQTSRVENPFALQPNDTSLSAAVSETLNGNSELAPYNIHVETANSTVFLSGYVKTIRQSDTAGALAGKVPGVKTVENNIIVRKWLK